MCENDYLLTYNPRCIERHSDSSDFEDNESSQRSGRDSILRKKMFRRTEMVNYEKEMRSKRCKNSFGKAGCVYENHAVHPRQCTCNECIIPVEEKVNQMSFKRRTVKYCNDEDKRSLHKTPSRLSVVRSKIMPCLSNIFGRSNHSKRDDHTKDKHLNIHSTRDNSCQVYCLNCHHKQFKKFNRKHDYVVQAVYSTEDDLDYSPDSGIYVDSAPENLNAEYNGNYDFTPSSITTNFNIQAAKKKFKKIVEREFRKAHVKKHTLKRTQEQQHPSKPNFQIFSTPKMSKIDHQSLHSDLRNISSFGCNVMPSNSSMFWEYLVERINKKYQNSSRGGLIKSCHCSNTMKCPNARDPLLNDGTGSQFDYKTNEQGTQGSHTCTCKSSLRSQSPERSRRNTQMVSSAAVLPPGGFAGGPPGASDGSTPGIGICPISGKPCPSLKIPETPPSRSSGKKQKVECKCRPLTKRGPPRLPGGSPNHSPGVSPGASPGLKRPGEPSNLPSNFPSNFPSNLPSNLPSNPPSTLPNLGIERPCQEPHDQIKDNLQKKYNGEVLCIHNPPCILINGCLNLPPVKGQFSPTAWPVTQVSSFHGGYQNLNISKQNKEQGCQYQPPPEFLTYPVVNTKTEKITQSICNHDPPCEVVRCCYKPEFDPKLENSCVHVPMCQKLPECILNESDRSSKCEHEPKCAEMPVCKRVPRKYIVMRTTDDMSTQVKPNAKLECKHVPPCIMIPKCLGKLMCDGYVPCDAIPDCVHQPACELIPACCRKSAKMVSTACQYPANCRIV